MSTWMYLQCLDHDPPLLAEDESGQHWEDVPRIRREVRDRDALVNYWDNNPNYNWSFSSNTIKFLAVHRKCNVGIVTEYGEEVPLDD